MKKIFISFFLISLFLFLKVDTTTSSVEKRIYTHYTKSVVEDLDFNVINQIPTKEAWLLTPTLNYPDMHSNGVAVLWAPFFLVAKLISAGADQATKDLNYRLTEAFANIFWGLLSLALLWRLMKRLFPTSISRNAILLSLLCTPFAWYLIFQPDNADISSLFLATSLIYLYFERKTLDPLLFSFLWAQVLFFSYAVKFDLIFVGLLYAHFMWEILKEKRLKTMFKSLAFFLLGAAPMLFSVLINEKIKYGFFNYGYLDTVSGQMYLLFENLFSSTGYFTTHPFYAVLIIFVLANAFTKRMRAEFWFLMLIPVLKVVLESFTYFQNEAYGPRHWVNNMAEFTILTGFVLQSLNSKFWKRVFFGLCASSFLLSIVAALIYKNHFDLYVFGGDWLGAVRKSFAFDCYFLFQFPHFFEKMRFNLFLIILSLLCGFGAVFLIRKKDLNILYPAIIVGALSYGALTITNYFFNERSVKFVSPVVLNQAVIGQGHYISSFFENAGCLQRAETYYTLKGDMKTASDRRRLLENYVAHAASEVVRDPVGFKSTLGPGRKSYVPARLWDDE